MNDIEICRRVAHIMGESSAAQKALDKYEILKSQGRKPAVVGLPNNWIVIHDKQDEYSEDKK